MAFERNGSWCAKIEVAATKEQVWLGTFETQSLAEDAEEKARWRIRNGLPPREPRITVAEYGEVWLATNRHKQPSTQDDYARSVKRITAYLGDRRLSAVNSADAERLAESLSDKGLGPQTIRKTLQVLGMVLKHAYKSQKRDTPPPEIDLPAPPRPKKRALSPEEFGLVLEKSQPYWRPLFMTIGHYGLRFSEAAGITVDDVDFANQRLHIRQGMTREGTLGPLKTDNAYRSFALSGAMAEMLQQHMEHLPPSRDNLLFPMPSGAPIRASNFYRSVMKSLKEDTGLAELSLHAMRRMYATELAHMDADSAYVLKHMGHSDLATAHRHYINLRDEPHDLYQESLESRLAGVWLRSSSVASHGNEAENAEERGSDSPADLGVLVVPPAGFEPATPGLGNLCSIP